MKTVSANADGEELRRQLATQTESLKQMTSSLPQIQEQKKYVNSHLLIAMKLLNMIGERDLNSFVTLEDSIFSSVVLDKNDILQLLKSEKASVNDKLRLLAIYFLSKDNLPSSELDELESVISTNNPILYPYLLLFLKQYIPLSLLSFPFSFPLPSPLLLLPFHPL